MGPSLTIVAVIGLLFGVPTVIAQAQTSDPLAAMAVVRPTSPSPAPDFAFKALDGQEIRLRAFRGRPVLLTFLTTW